MEILIKLTQREYKLLSIFKENDSLSTLDDFGGWGDSNEFRTLKNNNLICRYYKHGDGYHHRYRLTELGEMAITQNT